MLALWIILGIIFWGIGGIIMYMIQARSTLYPEMWDNDDRVIAAIMACYSWLAIIGLGLKLSLLLFIKFLKMLEPKNKYKIFQPKKYEEKL